MNFELTAEQQLIQDTAKRFAAEDIAPTLAQEELQHEFRAERVAKMGALGFFSCALPEELGGSGMGFMESVLMAEQIARAEPRAGADGREVRHARAEEQIHLWLGRRDAAGLLRDDGAQHGLGRRQHEDPRDRPRRPLGSARSQDVDLAGARR
jgi:alkylation response protein AidB-like acyl-CoA dehydrogenase